jgi:hypothetical protein
MRYPASVKSAERKNYHCRKIEHKRPDSYNSRYAPWFATIIFWRLVSTVVNAVDPALPFDLTGAKVDVRMKRGMVTLPLALPPTCRPGTGFGFILLSRLRGVFSHPCGEKYFSPAE